MNKTPEIYYLATARPAPCVYCGHAPNTTDNGDKAGESCLTRVRCDECGWSFNRLTPGLSQSQVQS